MWCGRCCWGAVYRFIPPTCGWKNVSGMTSIDIVVMATNRRHPRTPKFSHNLGSNAGGLFKGVYLARTCDMINKDTGEPFKARDFHVGSVAKLPSVSLEVCSIKYDTTRYSNRNYE